MTSLAEKTYQLLKKVPRGRVTTYKALAAAVHTKGYRAIGQFMKHNPYAPEVPCHRVVASDGTIGGFMAKKAVQKLQKKYGCCARREYKYQGKKFLLSRKCFFEIFEIRDHHLALPVINKSTLFERFHL